MKKFVYLLQIFVMVLFVSCGSRTKHADDDAKSDLRVVELRHAKGFTIEQCDDYKRIVVYNPWDSTRILETYLLVSRDKELPDNLPAGTVVRTPLQRVAICTSIFVGEYFRLGDIDKVKAVSEPEYINIPIIKERLQDGSVVDLGVTVNLNVERLLASEVEALIISPFEESMHDKFKSNGISVLKNASYMEESPLGRTEWIKFGAAFLEKDSLAEEIFSAIEKRYMDIVHRVSKVKERPTVFAEKKYGDIWYVAGGNSYSARFYNDAGADYIWNDLIHNGSKPFTFERVYAKALDTQYWLIKYNNPRFDMTLDQLGREYPLYRNFTAYKNKNVFGVNSGRTPFYEVGPLEPDVVLADLVNIFHPGLIEGHQQKYYQKMK